MNAVTRGGARRPALPGTASRLGALVLAGALGAGCDDTVQPFQEEDAVFSIFGYLDLRADTQWVRVMPVRRTLFLDPEPIDAVVTLEHLGNGETVTLRDSLFMFVDPSLDAVAYAHNFWTTERLQPETSYRLRATRSDGASSTAHIVMPRALEMLYLELGQGRRVNSALAFLRVRAERLLFAETIYGMGRLHGDLPDTLPATSIASSDHWTFNSPDPGTLGVAISLDSMRRPGFIDVGRREIRIVAGRPDWPYHAGLPDLTITLPGTAPSNVENGLGFLGGVAAWTIPFDTCDVLEAAPGGENPCETAFDAQSASIAGRVIREPCGDPYARATVRLTESFAGGGAILRTWTTGWRGEYRFEGIEPGAELLLEVGPADPAVQLPPLAVGERYTVEDISLPTGC